MKVCRPVLGIVAGALLAWPAAALDVAIDDADVRRAAELALKPERDRERFHQAYIVPVDEPSAERLEIITEFRRFVMEAERQQLLGNWMMARGGYDGSGRTLKDLLNESRGQVTLRLQVRLHPLHTFTELPALELVLGDPPLLPVRTARTSITTGSPDDPPALTGAVLEQSFNAPSIGDATLPLTISFGGKTLARTEIDFSRVD